jgi:hypothetical protein
MQIQHVGSATHLWCDVDEYANEIAIFGHNSICAPVAL